MIARIRRILQFLRFKKPTKPVQIVVDEEIFEEAKSDDTPAPQFKMKKKKVVIVWEMDHGLLLYPTAKYDSRFFTAYALNDTNKRVNGTFVYGPYQVGNKFPMAGWHEIFVTFLPADNLYESVTSCKTIYIEQDTPMILWTLPSDHIEYGNPLTSHYFKATTQYGDSSMVYSHSPDCILDMGTHVLTATYTPTGLNAINYVQGISVTREITVKGALTALSWTDPTGLFSADRVNTYPFTITSKHYQGISINEYPQLPGVFQYSPPVNSVINAGSTVLTVTFTPADGVHYLPCSVSREIKVDRATPVLHWPPPVFIYENYVLDDEILSCVTSTTMVNKIIKNSTTSLPGIFVYNPPHGTVMKELGPVTLTCEFIPQDAKNYVSNCAEISTKVLKGKPPLIDWPSPEPLVHPQPLTRLELNAKVKGCYPGDFIYDPPIGTVLNVGKHELKVTFLSKTVGKTDCFGSTTIEVTVGTPLLTWDKPFDLIDGVPLTEVQLNCKCSNVREGKFIYNPPIGTRLKKGLKHVLMVTFVPTGVDRDNFTRGTLKQIINVTNQGKKIPRVEFPTPPGPIRFPAPITLETHLKAVCLDDLPGKFEYFPAPDSILDVGENFLAVDFTPSDKLNWNRTRRSAWITVLPATPQLIWKSPPFMSYKEPLGADHYDVKAVLSAIKTNGGTTDDPVFGRFYYDPPIGTILDAGEHILTCRFEPFGKNYIPIEKKNNVMVSRCYPQLEWLPPKETSIPTYPYEVKQKLHLTAKCVYPLKERRLGEVEAKPIDGKFEYSHKEGDILSAGETTLTVLFLPFDSINMYSATASIKLCVAKKTPYILWDKALRDNGNLQYGKKITKAYVSVSVIEIEGTFDLNYPVGYVFPHIGEYTLTATFTPSEQYLHNFTITTIERKVTITPKRLFIGWDMPPVKGEQDKISYLDLADTHLLQQRFGAKILQDNLNSFDQRNLGISSSDLTQGTFEFLFPTKAATNQIVRVTYFPPSEYKDDYYCFSIERTVNVTAVRPELTWLISLKERTIPYGLPISRENILKCQCRAYAGNMVYENRIIGSTPTLGRYKAYARFVPSYAQYQNNVVVVKSSIGYTISKAIPKIIWEPMKYVPYGYVLSAKDFAATAVAPYLEDEEEKEEDIEDDSSADDSVVVSDIMRVLLERVCIDEEIPCRKKEKIIKPIGLFEKCIPEYGTVLTTKRNVLTMQFTPQGAAAYYYRKVQLIREIYIDDKK